MRGPRKKGGEKGGGGEVGERAMRWVEKEGARGIIINVCCAGEKKRL